MLSHATRFYHIKNEKVLQYHHMKLTASRDSDSLEVLVLSSQLGDKLFNLRIG